MKNIFLAILFICGLASADTMITGLPVLGPSSVGSNDVFPFVNLSLNETAQIKLSQILQIPSLQNPSFTGTVSAASFVGPLTGNASTATSLSATLTVPAGGTGQTTLTNHGLLVGAGTGNITQLGAAAAGTLLTGAGASSDPAFSATPTIGINGTTGGTLSLATSTGSGNSVTLQNLGTTTGWNFNLPTTAGSSGQPLLSGGGGSSNQSYGTLGVGGGGTGQASNWTANGVIYANSTTTLASSATGNSGQVLTSNGSSSAPTFQTFGGPTASYAQAYFGLASSWSTTSTSFAAPTNSGGNTLTVRTSSGITVTAASSNHCGITFTPASSSDVYLVSVTFSGQNSTAGDGAYFELIDNNSVVISAPSFIAQQSTVADVWNTIHLNGIYVPATGSAVTVSLFAAVNAGAAIIQNPGTLGNSVEWNIVRIF